MIQEAPKTPIPPTRRSAPRDSGTSLAHSPAPNICVVGGCMGVCKCMEMYEMYEV